MPSKARALLECGHEAPVLLDVAALIAREAGASILPFYRGATAVRTKADSSPVTEADVAADRLILAALTRLEPAIAIVSEESVECALEPAFDPRAPFWLVDPLDGTKEVLAQRDEFTVNIALIEHARPVLGVVHIPARDETYAGLVGEGAWLVRDGGARESIAARVPPPEGLIALASRSHRSPAVDTFLRTLKLKGETSAGSALKFCLIAQGRADVYPRFGRTMEWDTGAGQAVLEAAGGRVLTLDGRPLSYGKPGFANPDFIAWGRSAP